MNLRARLLMFAIGISVVGCRTEGDRPPEPELIPEATGWQRPAPEPAPAIDRSLGAGFELRQPIADGRLTLVPIIATRAASPPAAAAIWTSAPGPADPSAPPPLVTYVTLNEGLASGDVQLTEAGGLIVDTLRVVNHSAHPLFVLQGELVLDGMQDRVLAETAVIGPGATAMLNVRCVEHSRSAGGREFHASGIIAELSVRRTIAHEQQQEVWQLVDFLNNLLHLTPPTHTYRIAAAAQSQGDNAVRRTALHEQLLRREEHDLIVGFAVQIDGQIVALDRVATPALFRKFERMLLASYLVNTDGRAPDRPTFDPAAIRGFAAGPLAVTTAASTVALTERSAAERAASSAGRR